MCWRALAEKSPPQTDYRRSFGHGQLEVVAHTHRHFAKPEGARKTRDIAESSPGLFARGMRSADRHQPSHIQARRPRRLDQGGHLADAGPVAGGSYRHAITAQVALAGPIALPDSGSTDLHQHGGRRPPAREAKSSLNAVEALPEVDVRGKSGKFVALEPTEEMPADAGRGCRSLGQQLLGVVLPEVKQARPDGGFDRFEIRNPW